MKLHQLTRRIKRRVSKRVGRGNASGKGTYSARGLKGQKSRSGYSQKPAFEGGQTSLTKRTPKKRGFKNIMATPYTIVNIADIEARFAKDDMVNHKTLAEKKLVSRKPGTKIKILGNGTLTKPLTVHAHAFSTSAKDMISKQKGKAIIIGPNNN
jgi:large subunit ribosomal protein L15